MASNEDSIPLTRKALHRDEPKEMTENSGSPIQSNEKSVDKPAVSEKNNESRKITPEAIPTSTASDNDTVNKSNVRHRQKKNPSGSAEVIPKIEKKIHKNTSKDKTNANPLSTTGNNDTIVEEKSNVAIPKNSKNILKFMLAGIVTVVSVFIILFTYNAWQNSSVPILDVNAIVSILKPEFEGQPEMSLKIIRSSLVEVAKPDPKLPATLLLLAAEGAEDLSLQLAQKLVKAISSNTVHISGSEYTQLDANQGKSKIDDLLKSSLSTKEYNAVLVEDLHLISGGTALMFHAYCDHDNAPFKRSVFVMTIASGKKIPKDWNSVEWDETVSAVLSESWKDIDGDQMEPLLSRLLNTIVITPNSTL